MPSCISAPNCSGVPPSTVIPLSSSLPRTSGALSAVTILAFRRVTMSAGKPGGPRKPNHEDGFWNAGMISDIERTCGSLAYRAGSSTARILIRPVCMAGIALDAEMNPIGMCPLITSQKLRGTAQDAIAPVEGADYYVVSPVVSRFVLVHPSILCPPCAPRGHHAAIAD